MNKKRQLTKSGDNYWWKGVIGGIGQYFGLSADMITVLRILVVVLFFGSFFTLLVVYLIIAMILPDADGQTHAERKYRHKQNYQQPWKVKNNRKIKEAEKVDDDDWSDF